MLVTLALIGALAATQSSTGGPAAPAAKTVVSRAARASAAAGFGQAGIQLQSYYADNGTYAGATLPSAFGVVIARADTSSYCLQAGTGPTAEHVVGPGGTPTAGSC